MRHILFLTLVLSTFATQAAVRIESSSGGGGGGSDEAYPIATNALEIAQAALTAEVDPIAYPVATNALARLKQLEQYGDADIVPSPDEWFTFSGGTITGFNYVSGREHVVVPYEHNGIPVTSIGAWAFSDVDTGEGKPVVSVIAPKTATSIGAGAFDSCTALTSVSFPSATSIGAYAFYNCIELTSVSFPSATSIGDNAFYNCIALTSVSLPAATSIGAYAFYNCIELTSVSFPSATSIGADAFEDCTALTSVSLPAATSIGSDAFDYCTALTSITLGKIPPTTWQAGTIATATIYVPHDAVGYSDTFEGMPVIRATESAANFYLGGKTLEDRFLTKANAETIYTGSVCPASSGTQYYWTTGTNVTLSVGTLTAGKPVNIAKINNSATNSITALGQAGWVWTGGDMTNTITAGKSMTFGFLVDPSNGKTNAYATGVSK